MGDRGKRFFPVEINLQQAVIVATGYGLLIQKGIGDCGAAVALAGYEAERFPTEAVGASLDVEAFVVGFGGGLPVEAGGEALEAGFELGQLDGRSGGDQQCDIVGFVLNLTITHKTDIICFFL